MLGLDERQGNAAAWYVDRHVAEGRGTTVCLRTEQGTFTYGALAAHTSRLGNVLSDIGVEMENRVLLVLPDSPLLVAAMFAAMRVGAVAVPVSTRLTSADYAFLTADCRPRVAIVGPEHVAALSEARASTGYPSTICLATSLDVQEATAVAGGDGVANVERTVDLTGPIIDLDALVAQASASCPVAATSLDDMALFQYTSGTTGVPKGVVHLHRGLLGLPECFGSVLRLTSDDVCFSAAKISFGYGTGNSVLFPLAVGSSAILHPGPADAHTILDIARKLRPSVFFAVPSLYASMLGVSAGREASPLASVRLCVSGGEPLNNVLRGRWRERFGPEILDGLGSTECLHIFMVSQPRPGSSGVGGQVVPGYAVKLLDDENHPVGRDEIGHLWVAGPPNAARYWNRHEQSVATMVGRWTCTGDQMFQDEDGSFHFVGRSDDIIKVGGLKVAPSEVEAAILEHPAVADCAVVGLENDEGIKTVTAYIRLRDGFEESDGLRRDLRNHAKERLAAHKRPRALQFIDRLPTTTTGKVARFKLRQAAGAGPHQM